MLPTASLLGPGQHQARLKLKLKFRVPDNGVYLSIFGGFGTKREARGTPFVRQGSTQGKAEYIKLLARHPKKGKTKHSFQDMGPWKYPIFCTLMKTLKARPSLRKRQGEGERASRRDEGRDHHLSPSTDGGQNLSGLRRKDRLLGFSQSARPHKMLHRSFALWKRSDTYKTCTESRQNFRILHGTYGP